MTDNNENVLFYVKQKMFKLKEAIKVFTDNTQTNQLYTINADRIIDFSARYNFTDMNGQSLGSIKRKGMRSLWRANYQVFDGDNQLLTIKEESVFVRFMDSLFASIPCIGLCAGFVFHPSYLIAKLDGTEMMRVKKKPALFEGKFKIEKLTEMSEFEEMQMLLSIMMMLLLERVRG
ncbi:hypothetical protein DSAG12_02124 [Promethearchaeum syntrophicum]|uniref:LURP-one-related n=1 Tax=Promethearchaeum syntrophicum TaxID=2594042 RepID=A0A5B9DB12_9ARCH|nr:hypothetical protein [Candidatus Prometheoarchaeum syntrophicum]